MNDFLFIGDSPIMLGGFAATGIPSGFLLGTNNQIYVMQESGITTLSTPQDIATFSEPVFNQMTLNMYPSGLQNVATVQFAVDLLSTVNFKGTARVQLKDVATVLSGIQTVDSILLADNDIVLRNVPVASGTTEFNGLYVVNEFGVWNRSPNMNDWSEVPQATVIITEGSGYMGTKWYADVVPSGTIDETSMKFIELVAAGDVQEAPYDNKTYGRKNGNWTDLAFAAAAYGYGDIKSSIQPLDHGGWVKLDGRAKSTLTPTQQNQATILGIGTNLPNATGAIPIQNGTTLGAVAGSMTKTITQANLPNVNLTAAAGGAHTHTATGANTSSAGNHSHVEGRSWDPGIASRYNAMDTGINSNYRAAGTGSNSTLGHLVSSGGDHTHAVNFTLANSATHTHTTSLGGAGQALDITPKSISVNTFIYLGV